MFRPPARKRHLARRTGTVARVSIGLPGVSRAADAAMITVRIRYRGSAGRPTRRGTAVSQATTLRIVSNSANQDSVGGSSRLREPCERPFGVIPESDRTAGVAFGVVHFRPKLNAEQDTELTRGRAPSLHLLET